MIEIHTKAECTSYPFGRFIQENTPEVNKLIKGFLTIEEFKDKKINLLCMGSSGAIVAAMFAMQVPNCVILHVKKEGEKSHSSNGFHSELFDNHINVMVDDFVATGQTVNNIWQRVKHACKIHCLCVTSNLPKDCLDFEPKYIVFK